MCVLSGFPRVQVNSSSFIELPVQWAELVVIKEKRPLTGTAWLASSTKYHQSNSFSGVVLTVGCNHDVALSNVKFWDKLILAAAAWQQSQMRLFSKVMCICLASATESGHSVLKVRRLAPNLGSVAKSCRVLSRNWQCFPSAGVSEVVHSDWGGVNIQFSPWRWVVSSAAGANIMWCSLLCGETQLRCMIVLIGRDCLG